MGRNKKLRSRLEGLERNIIEHQVKVEEEQASKFPNLPLINHWQREIDNWRKEQQRLSRRLQRER